MHQPTKEQIIETAACHTCCARLGKPCTFARRDDPYGKRAAARQSHLDRIQRARKKLNEALDAVLLGL